MHEIIRILSLFSLLVIISCSDSKSPNYTFFEKEIEPSYEKMTIIYDTLCKSWFESNNYIRFNPTNEDIVETERILEIAIKKGEFDFLKNPDLKIIREYYRQYICYFDENKHKIIRINAFCKNLQTPTKINGEIVWKPFDWKNNFVSVHDGGACYWTIFIDLTRKDYFDFNVNGEA